jgi:prolyl oligopeptidase
VREPDRWRGLLVVLTVALVSSAARPEGEPARLDYPPAPRGPVIEDLHGTAVADPYRWLEDLDSSETRAWTIAEEKLTRKYLSSLPSRGSIRERIAVLTDFEKFGLPFAQGGLYFYSRNDGQQDQSVLYAAKSLSGASSVVLDPNTLSADGSLAVTGYVASVDGALLAYGASVGGSDWTDWHVRDLATGKDLPDVIRFTKYYPPVFALDGRGLYYSAFPPPRAGDELSASDLGNALFYHALGTPTSADRRILGDPAHPNWQYEPYMTRDGRWLVVRVGEGEVGDTGRENVDLVDLRSATPVPVPVIEGFSADYVVVGADAGRIFFLTSLDAPRGRVIAIDPTQPGRDHWRTVIAQGPDPIGFTDPAVTLVDHQLIVQSLHDAYSRVRAFGLDGTLRRQIALPGAGTVAGFGGHPEDRETFYSFENLITPPTLYRLDLQSGRTEVFRRPQVRFDEASLEQRQVFYAARDGTRIPMLLAYRKGLKLDGHNPVLLYGYGGFGIPMLPTFKASHIAWLERGGLFAVANIRGGGEYGDAWHRQAIRSHKQVVFDDFQSAAEWLVANRYASPSTLAIMGGSNGGLLVGACITQRPDLYGAAVAAVGVLDMLRFDRFGQGAGWVGDYGSPRDPADFKALFAYSPVHNVRPGVRYPATLVITGDHDTRVMPMHSFKFAAALQAAQAGPAPVLLELESTSGHHGGVTQSKAIDQDADIFSFLFENLRNTL